MMHVRARRHNTMELIGHVCILYMQQIYHDFETTRTEKKVKSKQCPQLRLGPLRQTVENRIVDLLTETLLRQSVQTFGPFGALATKF